MATEYEHSAGLTAAVNEMIGTCSDFTALENEGLRIAAAFRSKMTGGDSPELEDSGMTSDLKKVNPLMRAFVDYDYILVVDQYSWNNVSQVEQQAMLHF